MHHIAIIQPEQDRVLARQRLAEQHSMPGFHARQYPRVVAADVVREEILARVVERPHRNDRIALIENRLGHVGGALRDEQAARVRIGGLLAKLRAPRLYRNSGRPRGITPRQLPAFRRR